MWFKEKELESTFVEIRAKNGKWIVLGSLYRPPNTNSKEFISGMQSIISKTQIEKKGIDIKDGS